MTASHHQSLRCPTGRQQPREGLRHTAESESMWCRPPPLGRPMLKPRAPLPGSPLGSPVGRLCEGGTAARPCVSPRLSASEFARLPVSRGFPSRLGSCPPYGPLHTWHTAQLNIFLVGIGLGFMLVSVPSKSRWYCLQAVAITQCTPSRAAWTTSPHTVCSA